MSRIIFLGALLGMLFFSPEDVAAGHHHCHGHKKNKCHKCHCHRGSRCHINIGIGISDPRYREGLYYYNRAEAVVAPSVIYVPMYVPALPSRCYY